MFVIARTNRATNKFDYLNKPTSLTPSKFCSHPLDAAYFLKEEDALSFWKENKQHHIDDLTNPIYKITISEVQLKTIATLPANN